MLAHPITGRGQVAAHVGERHDSSMADVVPQREPNLAKRPSAPLYSRSSGASPRTLASGPSTARITSPTVISSGGRPATAAVRAAPALDQAVVAQVAEDVLEEAHRDVLGGGDLVALHRAGSNAEANSMAALTA